MTVGASTAVHLYYRSYGGHNTKPRPAYFSKGLALASFLRAAEAVDPAPFVTFVNDGPIPVPLLRVMESAGRVIPLTAGSNRASYRDTLARAARESLADEVVWFAEDDYLYRRDALLRVQQAANACADAGYFTLYCSSARDTTTGRKPVALPLPGADGVPDALETGDVRWFPAMSTTSTFGVRAATLREDVRLLRLCPYAGAAWDETTCRTYQGLQPFTAAELRADLLAIPPTPRAAARGLARLVISARSLRRAGRRRLLLGSDPELVRHMELEPHDTDPAPSGRTLALDWEAEARDVAAWASKAGLDLPDVPSDAGGER